jgi:hypothetical protein
VIVGDIDLDRNGEEVFKEARSLIFKKLVVNRIYDRRNDSLVYLAHTREVQQGSAKMSISTVALHNARRLGPKSAANNRVLADTGDLNADEQTCQQRLRSRLHFWARLASAAKARGSN